MTWRWRRSPASCARRTAAAPRRRGRSRRRRGSTGRATSGRSGSRSGRHVLGLAADMDLLVGDFFRRAPRARCRGRTPARAGTGRRSAGTARRRTAPPCCAASAARRAATARSRGNLADALGRDGYLARELGAGGGGGRHRIARVGRDSVSGPAHPRATSASDRLQSHPYRPWKMAVLRSIRFDVNAGKVW